MYLDEDAAREYLEQQRWPNGVVCPHYGAIGSYKLQPKVDSRRPVRKGVWKCKSCRKQFTVRVGTIFEDSHIPLYQWLSAIEFLCASKKGISAHQLHRMLNITYKSAWFMAHRIRYAMEQPPLVEKLQGIVEADETYIGGKSHGKRGRGADNKVPVFTLVQRDGDARSFKTERVTAKNLKGIIREHVDKESIIMTDEFLAYKGLKREFAHHTVNHSQGEYVRGKAHTNTAEGYFSLLKRGIIGTYHHVSQQHLDRYLAEFDFRYNSRKVEDDIRVVLAINGTKNKRLAFGW
ncbi:MAG: IS1595 family transposase [Dehalococcoidia bacterium]|nr:IS1595 family transposase [Dehalococcoidia bacterium]